jgi:hypothetical protein
MLNETNESGRNTEINGVIRSAKTFIDASRYRMAKESKIIIIIIILLSSVLVTKDAGSDW